MKTLRILGVLAVCALAGALYAKPLKVKALTPAGPGVAENPDADGMAMMHYKEGNEARTDIKVHIMGFLPNTVYGVQIDPGVSDPQAITTNPAGNGHWSFSAVGSDLTQFNPTVRIYRWDGNISEIGNVTFDELRAIGCVSGNCPVGQSCSVDADCDDGFLCTIDSCNGGFCFYSNVSCDDGNPCTFDFCRPEDGGCDNDPLPNCTP